MTRLAAVALFSLAALAAAAQNIAESVEVHVLEIEAVVLDRAGKAVAGLGRNDFEVMVDGKPAEVTNFFAVNRGEIVETRDASASADATEAPPQRVATRLIIFFDDLHLHAHSRKRAIDGLRSYAQANMAEGTTVTLIRWNGSMRTVLKPTTDREALLRALTDIERESTSMLKAHLDRKFAMRQIDDVILHPIPNMQDAQASAAMANAMTYVGDRTREAEQTIGALTELITVSSGLEGRKILLYVSEALPQQPGVEVLEYGRQVFTRNPVPGFQLEHNAGGRSIDSVQFDQTRAFVNLASLAQSAGVVFSALDPGGARTIEGSGAEYVTSLARLDAMFIRDNESAGARLVAAQTGGRFVENENNLQHAISVLTDDVSTYYSLGVRPPNRRAHDVSVRVKGRTDLRVLTPRRKAMKSEQEAIAGAVRARLYSREEANPLDVRVIIGAPWPRGERCVAPVQVIVPAAKLVPLPGSELAVHAMVLDDAGRESALRSSRHAVSPATGSPATIAFDFGLKPKRYVFSIAVIEKASGTTSYLQADVDASICGR